MDHYSEAVAVVPKYTSVNNPQFGWEGTCNTLNMPQKLSDFCTVKTWFSCDVSRTVVSLSMEFTWKYRNKQADGKPIYIMW